MGIPQFLFVFYTLIIVMSSPSVLAAIPRTSSCLPRQEVRRGGRVSRPPHERRVAEVGLRSRLCEGGEDPRRFLLGPLNVKKNHSLRNPRSCLRVCTGTAPAEPCI